MKRSALVLAVVAALAGCDWNPPGKPTKAGVVVAPQAVANFRTLYLQNCAGCHGADDSPSGAIALDNPTYLAVVPRETLQKIITDGVPGSLMPAFAISAGGSLTDAQITILVDGIMAWKKPAAPGAILPAYSAPPGDAAAGAATYAAYVDSLRKTLPKEVFADGFMANASFLGLATDQYLRTLIIAGRPELGIPDFQGVIPGQPLTEQQIADVVAWLISQRQNEFGQPPAAPLP